MFPGAGLGVTRRCSATSLPDYRLILNCLYRFAYPAQQDPGYRCLDRGRVVTGSHWNVRVTSDRCAIVLIGESRPLLIGRLILVISFNLLLLY